MKGKDRFEFGKDMVKVLNKHFKLDGVTILSCDVSCDGNDLTKIKLEMEF